MFRHSHFLQDKGKKRLKRTAGVERGETIEKGIIKASERERNKRKEKLGVKKARLERRG